MDDGGASLPLGSAADALRAVPLTNADGSHAVLIRDSDRPMVLVSVGHEARAGRVLVTALDDAVELRTDREAAAEWIARGSVSRSTERVPAWANVIGLLLVLLIFGLTVIGTLSVIGWLADAIA